MDVYQAVLLGFFQGVTEFLPVSSSGHLVLGETFFQLQPSEFLFFDLILHLATLLAVCLYFKNRLIELISNVCLFFFKKEQSRSDVILSLAILLSTVITGSIGIAFKDFLEQLRDQLPMVGVCFLLTGVLLLSTRFYRTSPKEETPYPPNIWLFAVSLGLAQALAIAPGISRSGVTICTALLLGTARPRAVEYSFLMSIPAILGATILEMKDATLSMQLLPALGGFLSALVFGVLFLWILVWIVNKGKLHHFAYYTVPLGLWVLWYSL
ncbi:undecaprenyl-diphosphatase [bacterium]|nr:undecaprenyl-diphosphatase [bacterium]